MDKKKTLDERLLDAAITVFFIGLFVALADFMGADLNWISGIGIMILSVLYLVLIAIMRGIVYAIRQRRKARG